MLLSLLAAACASREVATAVQEPFRAERGVRVAVRAARVLDVRTGKLLQDAVVEIEGDSIVAVREGGARGAGEVDLGDVTLLPGLFDCHVHLGGSLEGDFVNRSVHEGAVDTVLRAAKHASITLRAGFTTVRNVGSSDFVDVALMRAIERGDVEGPRIIPCGHSIGITGGHADETGFRPGILVGGPAQGIADGPDECRKAVREQIKYGARAIKCVATAGVLSFEEQVGAQQLTDEELAAIVDEARRHGVKVAAHAHGTEGILAAVRAGVDSIEHGSLLDERCIEEMKRRGTFLVPTTYLAERIDLERLPPLLRRKAESVLPRARENLRRAIGAGVRIACGTDAAVYPHGENARELEVYVRLGMTPLEALRSATIHAAELCDASDRGEIAPGKLADLIAVPGNPIEDVTALQRVSFVMLGGRIVTQPSSESASVAGSTSR
jgi:imidazolonepropionase-like amidohydrolase